MLTTGSTKRSDGDRPRHKQLKERASQAFCPPTQLECQLAAQHEHPLETLLLAAFVRFGLWPLLEHLRLGRAPRGLRVAVSRVLVRPVARNPPVKRGHLPVLLLARLTAWLRAGTLRLITVLA